MHLSTLICHHREQRVLMIMTFLQRISLNAFCRGIESSYGGVYNVISFSARDIKCTILDIYLIVIFRLFVASLVLDSPLHQLDRILFFPLLFLNHILSPAKHGRFLCVQKIRIRAHSCFCGEGVEGTPGVDRGAQNHVPRISIYPGLLFLLLSVLFPPPLSL